MRGSCWIKFGVRYDGASLKKLRNVKRSPLIYDEKTTSISGAFTREKARGGGIATALLNRSLEWAHAAGYERCAVDFEPMNPLATRFWLRHFEPVCYTLIRHVDKREA